MRAPAYGLIAMAAASCHAKTEEKTLTVAAAISLKEPLEELAKRYEAAHPRTRVALDLGASGDLSTQIAHGAPVDVFVSAGPDPIERLKKSASIVERCVVATNALVLVRKPSATADWSSLDRCDRVAIGLVPAVPAGAYAEEALRKLGVWDALKPKIVRGANVRAVLDLVAHGEADCGLVYATDARDRADVVVVGEPPEHARPRVTYPLVVVSKSDDARALADFLCGDEARAALTARGFRGP